MTDFIVFYFIAWTSFCILCISIIDKNPCEFSLLCDAYLKFLFVRWKVITFIVSSIGIVIIAPYTGDQTWDYFDAAIMSILTYLTAPWAVGTLFRWASTNRIVTNKQAMIAVCLWLFSASWCYDLYLLVRDGIYPITWWSNMIASSVLYLTAGLFWNLEWSEDREMIFSFNKSAWPVNPKDESFKNVFWYALPFMIIAVGSIGYFLL